MDSIIDRFYGQAARLSVSAASLFVGSRFRSALSEMQRAQWLSPDELRGRTQANLEPLLQHAVRHVPFYREHCRNAGIDPERMRSIEQLALLPICTKATYRQKGLDSFVADNMPAHRRLPGTTSGSTGEPFVFYLDREAMPYVFASHLFYDSWFGLRTFDRHVKIMMPAAPSPANLHSTPALAGWRYRMRTSLQSMYEQVTQMRISVTEVVNDRIEELYESIERFRPDYILGYTSSLCFMADLCTRRGLQLSRPMKGIITVAETLTPHRRQRLEEFFRGPVINRYGQREFKFWAAQSCNVSPESFHVNTELVHAEVVRRDGTPASPGETGRIILTNLTNYVMPMLRYDTGDLGAIGRSQCACGRGFPLITHLAGRSVEYAVTLSGDHVNSIEVGHHLFVTNRFAAVVSQYQLIQETRDSARLLVVPSKGFVPETDKPGLKSAMEELLGPGFRVSVELTDDIPLEPSGKRPIVKRLTGTAASELAAARP